MKKKLSIIIPCYNEGRYIARILDHIKKIELPDHVSREIIIVNDGSTDETASILNNLKAEDLDTQVEIINKPINQGKGAAITSGIQYVTGDYVVIQDADLEYDPKDYNKMLLLFLEDKADVVFGSRFRGSEPHRVLFFMHTIGNKLLTFLSNLFTQLNLTDMESGYKMFRSEIIKNLELQEKRFGFEPEVTAKISKIEGIRIYEVGISYYGRTYSEGKKINWKDGFRALYCIIRYNLFK